MKSLTINNKFISMATAMLLTILFLFLNHANAATSGPAPTKFDHTQTGFILKDIHLTLRCEQCHVDGIFKNTPKNCAGCHAPGTRVGAMPQPINHVQTSAACDTCHTSTSSFQVKSFNHAGVTGNCTTCHNSQSLGVVSVPSTHIPLSAYTMAPDCGSCHTNTATFMSYTSVNLHAGITSGCSQCHGGPAGADAGSGTIGTYPNVVKFNQATHFPLQPSLVNCIICHTQTNTLNFSTFLNATYSHTTADSGRCGSCHEGQYAGVVSYVSGVHIPLPAASNCTPCHFDPSGSPTAKPTFLGAVFHTSTNGSTSAAITTGSGTCATCHNGSFTSQNAQPVGKNHIVTSADCSTCHTDSTNSSTQPNNTSNYTVFTGAKFHLSATGLSPATCLNCHNGSYLSEGAYSKTSVLPTHIPVSASTDCLGCHTASNTGSFTTFQGAYFHQTTAGNTSAAANASGGGKCVTCHDGTYTAQSAQAVGATHIPFTADCSVCHTDSTGTPANNTSLFTTFQGSVFHKTTLGNTVAAADAAGSGKCVTCHNGSYLTEGVGADSLTSVTGSHIPVLSSTDCGTCHTASNTSSFTTFLNSVFHTTTLGNTSAAADAAGGGKCITCHNGSYLAQNALAEAASHIPTSLDCSVCHTDSTGTPSNNTGTFTTFGGAYFHQTTAGNPPTGTCTTCHGGGYETEGVGGIGAESKASSNSLGAFTHLTTTADCVSCHTASNTSSYTNFLNASYSHSTTYPTGFPQVTGQSTTCASCHNGTTAKGKVATHVSTPQGADCNASGCHTPSTNGCGTTGNCITFYGVVYSHTTANTPYAANSFPQTTAAPTPGCITCHAGGTLSAFPVNSGHVTIGSLDCNYCHTPTDTTCGTTGACSTFLGAKFNHGSVAAGSCGTCHSGSLANTVSINNTLHIPQTYGNACDTCHLSTGTNGNTGIAGTFPTTTQSFLGVLFHKTTVGSGTAPLAQACTTCHTGTFLTTQATPASTTSSIISTHVTIGSTDCGTCHTQTNTSGYTTFLNGIYVHTVANNSVCGTCHLGQYANVVSLKTSTHIPIASGIPANACDVCHVGNTTSFTTPNLLFHSTTYGSSAMNQTCSSCHSGTYMSTQTTPAYSKTGQNGSHIPTTAECGTCHTSAYTSAFTNFVYTPAYSVMVHNSTITPASGCGTCHLGQFTGVISLNNATHIPQSSGNACDVCHSYVGSPPTFSGVLFHKTSLGTNPTGTCTTCHNGTYYQPAAVSGATGGNSGLAATGAQGKSSVSGFTHITTTADCVTCHTASNTSSYTTFLGAGYSHTATYPSWTTATTVFPSNPASPKTCASCHDGTTAVGVNTGHPVIGTSDCVACHTATILQGCPNCTLFGIPAAAVHTTTFLGSATCVSCHDGSKAVGLASDANHIPIGSIDCKQCHSVYDGSGSINFSTTASANVALAPTPTGGTVKYVMNHTGTSTTACGTSCHNGSYTSQGINGAAATTSVSNHIPTTIVGSADCGTCHKTQQTSGSLVTGFAAGTSLTSWTADTMNHNNAQGGAPNYCVTCHLSTAKYLGKMQKKSHNGASTSKDCSVSGCHKPLGSKGTSWSKWT